MPLSDCGTRDGFRRATPEVTGNRLQAPEPCTNKACRQRSIQWVPRLDSAETLGLQSPTSSGASSTTPAKPTIEECNLEGTTQATDRHVRATHLLEYDHAERSGRTAH